MKTHPITVKLNIKGKEVEISAAKTEDLVLLIEELFNKQVQYVPYPVYQYPQFVPVYRPWEVTCGTAGQAVTNRDFYQVIN